MTVRWDALPSPVSGYTAEFVDGDAQVWSQPAKPGDRVDARALEDTRAGFRVTASSSVDGPDTTFAITHQSQQIRTDGGVGAPLSRGAACFVQGWTGAVRLDPCPLTDGRFGASFPLQPCSDGSTPAPTGKSCPADTAVWVDLGESRPVRTIFAHGLAAAALTVDSSDDGVRWTNSQDRARIVGIRRDFPASDGERAVCPVENDRAKRPDHVVDGNVGLADRLIAEPPSGQ